MNEMAINELVVNKKNSITNQSTNPSIHQYINPSNQSINQFVVCQSTNQSFIHSFN
eukprot:m.38413 g.38413  ORF g.38413 m.38413 type:complete len:56 (+) comp17907_c4_seq1:2787-2954(+)